MEEQNIENSLSEMLNSVKNYVDIVSKDVRNYTLESQQEIQKLGDDIKVAIKDSTSALQESTNQRSISEINDKMLEVFNILQILKSEFENNTDLESLKQISEQNTQRIISLLDSFKEEIKDEDEDIPNSQLYSLLERNNQLVEDLKGSLPSELSDRLINQFQDINVKIENILDQKNLSDNNITLKLDSIISSIESSKNEIITPIGEISKLLEGKISQDLYHILNEVRDINETITEQAAPSLKNMMNDTAMKGFNYLGFGDTLNKFTYMSYADLHSNPFMHYLAEPTRDYKKDKGSNNSFFSNISGFGNFFGGMGNNGGNGFFNGFGGFMNQNNVTNQNRRYAENNWSYWLRNPNEFPDMEGISQQTVSKTKKNKVSKNKSEPQPDPEISSTQLGLNYLTSMFQGVNSTTSQYSGLFNSLLAEKGFKSSNISEQNSLIQNAQNFTLKNAGGVILQNLPQNLQVPFMAALTTQKLMTGLYNTARQNRDNIYVNTNLNNLETFFERGTNLFNQHTNGFFQQDQKRYNPSTDKDPINQQFYQILNKEYSSDFETVRERMKQELSNFYFQNNVSPEKIRELNQLAQNNYFTSNVVNSTSKRATLDAYKEVHEDVYKKQIERRSNLANYGALVRSFLPIPAGASNILGVGASLLGRATGNTQISQFSKGLLGIPSNQEAGLLTLAQMAAPTIINSLTEKPTMIEDVKSILNLPQYVQKFTRDYKEYVEGGQISFEEYKDKVLNFQTFIETTPQIRESLIKYSEENGKSYNNQIFPIAKDLYTKFINPYIRNISVEYEKWQNQDTSSVNVNDVFDIMHSAMANPSLINNLPQNVQSEISSLTKEFTEKGFLDLTTNNFLEEQNRNYVNMVSNDVRAAKEKSIELSGHINEINDSSTNQEYVQILEEIQNLGAVKNDDYKEEIEFLNNTQDNRQENLLKQLYPILKKDIDNYLTSSEIQSAERADFSNIQNNDELTKFLTNYVNSYKQSIQNNVFSEQKKRSENNLQLIQDNQSDPSALFREVPEFFNVNNYQMTDENVKKTLEQIIGFRNTLDLNDEKEVSRYYEFIKKQNPLIRRVAQLYANPENNDYSLLQENNIDLLQENIQSGQSVEDRRNVTYELFKRTLKPEQYREIAKYITMQKGENTLDFEQFTINQAKQMDQNVQNSSYEGIQGLKVLVDSVRDGISKFSQSPSSIFQSLSNFSQSLQRVFDVNFRPNVQASTERTDDFQTLLNGEIYNINDAKYFSQSLWEKGENIQDVVDYIVRNEKSSVDNKLDLLKNLLKNENIEDSDKKIIKQAITLVEKQKGEGKYNAQVSNIFSNPGSTTSEITSLLATIKQSRDYNIQDLVDEVVSYNVDNIDLKNVILEEIRKLEVGNTRNLNVVEKGKEQVTRYSNQNNSSLNENLNEYLYTSEVKRGQKVIQNILLDSRSNVQNIVDSILKNESSNTSKKKILLNNILSFQNLTDEDRTIINNALRLVNKQESKKQYDSQLTEIFSNSNNQTAIRETLTSITNREDYNAQNFVDEVVNKKGDVRVKNMILQELTTLQTNNPDNTSIVEGARNQLSRYSNTNQNSAYIEQNLSDYFKNSDGRYLLESLVESNQYTVKDIVNQIVNKQDLDFENKTLLLNNLSNIRGISDSDKKIVEYGLSLINKQESRGVYSDQVTQIFSSPNNSEQITQFLNFVRSNISTVDFQDLSDEVVSYRDDNIDLKNSLLSELKKIASGNENNLQIVNKAQQDYQDFTFNRENPKLKEDSNLNKYLFDLVKNKSINVENKKSILNQLISQNQFSLEQKKLIQNTLRNLDTTEYKAYTNPEINLSSFSNRENFSDYKDFVKNMFNESFPNFNPNSDYNFTDQQIEQFYNKVNEFGFVPQKNLATILKERRLNNTQIQTIISKGKDNNYYQNISSEEILNQLDPATYTLINKILTSENASNITTEDFKVAVNEKANPDAVIQAIYSLNNSKFSIDDKEELINQFENIYREKNSQYKANREANFSDKSKAQPYINFSNQQESVLRELSETNSYNDVLGFFKQDKRNVFNAYNNMEQRVRVISKARSITNPNILERLVEDISGLNNVPEEIRRGFISSISTQRRGDMEILSNSYRDDLEAVLESYMTVNSEGSTLENIQTEKNNFKKFTTENTQNVILNDDDIVNFSNMREILKSETEANVNFIRQYKNSTDDEKESAKTELIQRVNQSIQNIQGLIFENDELKEKKSYAIEVLNQIKHDLLNNEKTVDYKLFKKAMVNISNKESIYREENQKISSNLEEVQSIQNNEDNSTFTELQQRIEKIKNDVNTYKNTYTTSKKRAEKINLFEQYLSTYEKSLHQKKEVLNKAENLNNFNITETLSGINISPEDFNILNQNISKISNISTINNSEEFKASQESITQIIEKYKEEQRRSQIGTSQTQQQENIQNIQNFENVFNEYVQSRESYITDKNRVVQSRQTLSEKITDQKSLNISQQDINILNQTVSKISTLSKENNPEKNSETIREVEKTIEDYKDTNSVFVQKRLKEMKNYLEAYKGGNLSSTQIEDLRQRAVYGEDYLRATKLENQYERNVFQIYDVLNAKSVDERNRQIDNLQISDEEKEQLKNITIRDSRTLFDSTSLPEEREKVVDQLSQIPFAKPFAESIQNKSASQVVNMVENYRSKYNTFNDQNNINTYTESNKSSRVTSFQNSDESVLNQTSLEHFGQPNSFNNRQEAVVRVDQPQSEDIFNEIQTIQTALSSLQTQISSNTQNQSVASSVNNSNSTIGQINSQLVNLQRMISKTPNYKDEFDTLKAFLNRILYRLENPYPHSFN